VRRGRIGGLSKVVSKAEGRTSVFSTVELGRARGSPRYDRTQPSSSWCCAAQSCGAMTTPITATGPLRPRTGHRSIQSRARRRGHAFRSTDASARALRKRSGRARRRLPSPCRIRSADRGGRPDRLCDRRAIEVSTTTSAAAIKGPCSSTRARPPTSSRRRRPSHGKAEGVPVVVLRG
jgi:hypothetical protein